MSLSPYLITIIAAWIIAQGLKYVIHAIKSKSFSSLQHLYISGNMPSAHTATVIALATLIGLRDGSGSAVFAVSLLFAAIVMYDAVMVRRSSGEQGEAVEALIKERKSTIKIPRIAKGHTPLEVVAGFALGVAISSVVFIATK